MLNYDASKRITSFDALKHAFFIPTYFEYDISNLPLLNHPNNYQINNNNNNYHENNNQNKKDIENITTTNEKAIQVDI